MAGFLFSIIQLCCFFVRRSCSLKIYCYLIFQDETDYMKLNQIRSRHFWSTALAASALLAASTAIAHTADIDPAYLLDSELLAEQGIELKHTSPETFPLKRNSQGHWSIDVPSLYVSDAVGLRVLPPASDANAPYNVIQRRLGIWYEKQEYQRGFDEAISFIRAMHAQGIGVELIFQREYESDSTTVMMQAYKLRLRHFGNDQASYYRTSIPWHVPKVQHINPRSALSISQVSNAPAQDSR